jgi:hypothetical protein
METPEALSGLELFAKRRVDLELVAIPSTTYYRELSEYFDPIRRMAWLFAALVALASVAGGANTLNAAVQDRIRELATLRAVGHSGFTLARSLAMEALVIAAVGSIAGLLIARFALSGGVVRIAMGAFELDVDPPSVLIGVGGTLLVALIGFHPRGYPRDAASDRHRPQRDMKALPTMRYHSSMKSLTVTAALVAALFLAGCGDRRRHLPRRVHRRPRRRTSRRSPTPSNSPPRRRLFITAGKARAEAKTGDTVTVIGARPAGIPKTRSFPVSPSFTIVDPVMKPCGEDGMDSCKTPADYCCADRDEMKKSTIVVEFRDDGDRPFLTTAKGFGGIEPLKTVYVTRKGGRRGRRRQSRRRSPCRDLRTALKHVGTAVPKTNEPPRYRGVRRFRRGRLDAQAIPISRQRVDVLNRVQDSRRPPPSGCWNALRPGDESRAAGPLVDHGRRHRLVPYRSGPSESPPELIRPCAPHVAVRHLVARQSRSGDRSSVRYRHALSILP